MIPYVIYTLCMYRRVCCNVLSFSLAQCSNRSSTFPFENRKNIYRFAISPNGLLMITVDEGDSQSNRHCVLRKVHLHWYSHPLIFIGNDFKGYKNYCVRRESLGHGDEADFHVYTSYLIYLHSHIPRHGYFPFQLQFPMYCACIIAVKGPLLGTDSLPVAMKH